MPRGDHVLNYSDAEDILKDVDLKWVIIKTDRVTFKTIQAEKDEQS